MSPKQYGRTACCAFRTTWKLHWIVYRHTEQNPACPSRCTQPWEGFTCLGAKGVNNPGQAYPSPALYQVRGVGIHPEARDGSTFQACSVSDSTDPSCRRNSRRWKQPRVRRVRSWILHVRMANGKVRGA